MFLFSWDRDERGPRYHPVSAHGLGAPQLISGCLTYPTRLRILSRLTVLRSGSRDPIQFRFAMPDFQRVVPALLGWRRTNLLIPIIAFGSLGAYADKCTFGAVEGVKWLDLGVNCEALETAAFDYILERYAHI